MIPSFVGAGRIQGLEGIAHVIDQLNTSLQSLQNDAQFRWCWKNSRPWRNCARDWPDEYIFAITPEWCPVLLVLEEFKVLKELRTWLTSWIHLCNHSRMMPSFVGVGKIHDLGWIAHVFDQMNTSLQTLRNDDNWQIKTILQEKIGGKFKKRLMILFVNSVISLNSKNITRVK